MIWPLIHIRKYAHRASIFVHGMGNSCWRIPVSHALPFCRNTEPKSRATISYCYWPLLPQVRLHLALQSHEGGHHVWDSTAHFCKCGHYFHTNHVHSDSCHSHDCFHWWSDVEKNTPLQRESIGRISLTKGLIDKHSVTSHFVSTCRSQKSFQSCGTWSTRTRMKRRRLQLQL